LNFGLGRRVFTFLNRARQEAVPGREGEDSIANRWRNLSEPVTI